MQQSLTEDLVTKYRIYLFFNKKESGFLRDYLYFHLGLLLKYNTILQTVINYTKHLHDLTGIVVDHIALVSGICLKGILYLT